MQASKTCCDSCPLKSCGARGFVPDDIPAGAHYIIRGEAPGKADVEQGKPFQGQAGFVLKNWLIRAVPQLQVSLEKKKVGFSNVLKCLPAVVSGKPYPTGETRRQAEEHCVQFTSFPDTAHTIILCGEAPQRYHFGPELDKEDATDRSLGRDAKGVMGRVGRVYERDGKRWVFAPHPEFILKQPALVQQGQEALKIAVGVDKLVEPTMLKWGEAVAEIAKS